MERCWRATRHARRSETPKRVNSRPTQHAPTFRGQKVSLRASSSSIDVPGPAQPQASPTAGSPSRGSSAALPHRPYPPYCARYRLNVDSVISRCRSHSGSSCPSFNCRSQGNTHNHGLTSRGPRQEERGSGQWPRARHGFGDVSLALNVGSERAVDQVLAEAAAAGADGHETSGSHVLGQVLRCLPALDGHPWAVVHNPHWRLMIGGACSFLVLGIVLVEANVAALRISLTPHPELRVPRTGLLG